MLIYNNNTWQIATHIVKFTHNNEYREIYTIDVTYWQDFEKLWSDVFEIHEVVEFVATNEQRVRYVNVKNMPEDFGNIYSQYVENGTIAEHAHLLVNHPFLVIVNKIAEIKNAEIISELELAQAETNTMLLDFMEVSILG